MTDLEQSLRTMLRERAGDIQTLPTQLTSSDFESIDEEILDLPLLADPRRRRPILLAVAAIAILIAGILISVRAGHDSNHTRPAQPTPTTIPAPRATSLKACTTTVPASWTKPVSAATIKLPSDISNSAVEGVTENGAAVVVVDPTPSTGERIGVIAPGSANFTALYTLPAAGAARVADVDVQSQSILAEITGSTGDVVELVLIDAQSGSRRVITKPSSGRAQVIERAYLASGTVYWQGIDAQGNERRIYAYDIASRTTTTAAIDPILELTHSAAGITWLPRQGAAAPKYTLPLGLARYVTTDNFASFVSDGTTYAWVDGATLNWWSPTDGHVRISGAFTSGTSTITAVAGPLVYYGDEVLDARAGTHAKVVANRLFGHAGTFVGAPVLTRPRTTPALGLMRITAADLPKLSC